MQSVCLATGVVSIVYEERKRRQRKLFRACTKINTSLSDDCFGIKMFSPQ